MALSFGLPFLRTCESKLADNLAQLETQASDQQMQQKELMKQLHGLLQGNTMDRLLYAVVCCCSDWFFQPFFQGFIDLFPPFVSGCCFILDGHLMVRLII